MSSILNFIPRDPGRLITHGVLALLTLAAWGFTTWLVPDYSWFHSLTVATAYVSLVLIVFTLIWGPVKLFTQKRNPVNLMLRRDAGIWAGITGVVHVIAGFQVHMSGNIAMYFFEHAPDNSLKPLLNLFGYSNDIGLLATIVLVVLLFISNDLSLRVLRGNLWKWIQRSNYVLILLIIAHGIGYQVVIKRAPLLTGVVVGLSLVALVAQLVGVFITLSRSRGVRSVG